MTQTAKPSKLTIPEMTSKLSLAGTRLNSCFGLDDNRTDMGRVKAAQDDVVAVLDSLLIYERMMDAPKGSMCLKIERILSAFLLFEQDCMAGDSDSAIQLSRRTDIVSLLSELSHEAIQPVPGPPSKPLSGILLAAAEQAERKLSPGDVKVGDIVHLISGGPRMVVSRVETIKCYKRDKADASGIVKAKRAGTHKPEQIIDDQLITCNWFNRLNGHENWGLPASAVFSIKLLDSEV